MKQLFTILLSLVCTIALAQGTDIGRLGHNLRIEIESTTNVGGGKFAPMWLSSNRYGLASVKTAWNYERVALHRDIENDSLRNWRIGYGADIAVMFGGERTFCLQELFAEFAWKKVYITLGSKKQALSLERNHNLTSGGLAYGINARPIPQVRLGVDWFTFTQGWWKIKGHLSYGWKTDGPWQRAYLDDNGLLNKPYANSRRTEGTLYHEKALYFRFGRRDKFPLEGEIGLQWATEFGGKSYSFYGRGWTLSQTVDGVTLPSDFKAYTNALFVLGNDITDGNINNSEGNHLGSMVAALTWHGKDWKVKAYMERYFEDISQLGLTYGISDHLLGLEVELPTNPFLSNLVVEHMNSRNQTGAVYHDYSPNIPDKMNGRDNYYNHNIYTGWQNYGMSMGSPLLTSPLYNKVFGVEGAIRCLNNRVRAWHVGLSGNPFAGFDWRLMMTFSRNWGTYDEPLADPADQTYLMVEAGYAPPTWNGWSGRIALGIDRGDMLGNNTGCQLTIAKSFSF
ncbi:MAG: hypothetical protein HUK00_00445 [Bacteroidaceae bacterium]|nr:hypothetical protein [Bacteroidaceae bacterium]